MYKKVITISLLFLSCSTLQFTMLRNLSKKLQKSSGLHINSVFTNEFIRLSSSSQYRVSELFLLSQMPLDKDLENKVFKLAVEEEADVKMVASSSLLKEQLAMLEDMQQDGIDVGISSDWCLILKRFCLRNKILLDSDIHNDTQAPSSIMAALISYHSGRNIILIGQQRATVSMYDHKKFSNLQKQLIVSLFKTKK